jgi:hypothetical protein
MTKLAAVTDDETEAGQLPAEPARHRLEAIRTGPPWQGRLVDWLEDRGLLPPG